MNFTWATLSSVVGLTLQYFSTLSHNRRIFVWVGGWGVGGGGEEGWSY